MEDQASTSTGEANYLHAKAKPGVIEPEHQSKLPNRTHCPGEVGP